MDDVFVVDDDPGIRTFIGFALETMGVPYRTAAEARPRLIVLDRDMSVMDGVAFCAAFDATHGRDATAIVAMAASARSAAFRAACRADDALPKPFDLDSLTALVERHRPAA